MCPLGKMWGPQPFGITCCLPVSLLSGYLFVGIVLFNTRDDSEKGSKCY